MKLHVDKFAKNIFLNLEKTSLRRSPPFLRWMRLLRTAKARGRPTSRLPDRSSWVTPAVPFTIYFLHSIFPGYIVVAGRLVGSHWLPYCPNMITMRVFVVMDYQTGPAGSNLQFGLQYISCAQYCIFTDISSLHDDLWSPVGNYRVPTPTPLRGKAGRDPLNKYIYYPPPTHWDRRAIQPNHIKFRTCSAHCNGNSVDIFLFWE
jgi:hypothetical protein